MEAKKRPDNVVFNSDTQQYDAALKPYATSVGAPVITMTDTVSWKNRSISKVNQKVQAKYLEIKEEYDKMMEEFEFNNLIFSAKFNFEPIVGDTYHLYKRDNEELFLSLIAPHECSFNAMGSFYLNADQIWEKV
ncbi:DUF2452 domain-containing protein [Lutimonas sp.]|uniref:DUF2452 domain-containing protein n=1 Tax=Lutimonas sp. TaxID=1872403 RepID=UPI003D9B9912